MFVYTTKLLVFWIVCMLVTAQGKRPNAAGSEPFSLDEWAKMAGLKKETTAILRKEDLATVQALLLLEVEDLTELGLTLGQRKLLMAAVHDLKDNVPTHPSKRADTSEKETRLPKKGREQQSPYLESANDGSEQKHPIHVLTDEGTCGSSKKKFMLVADTYDHSLVKVDLETSMVCPLKLPPLRNPMAVEYDPRDERVYWSDVAEKSVYTAFLNGTGITVLVSKSSGISADGIALDLTANTLFYTNMANGEIGVMTLDGQKKRTLIKNSRIKPRDIALDIRRGYMYVSDISAPAIILRADLSGINQVIIASGMVRPNGLALDPIGKRLFWCDGYLGQVEQITLYGTQRKKIFSEPLSHFFGIEYDQNYLYLTDWQNSNIRKIKDDGTEVEYITPAEFLRASGLKVYRSSQALGISECSNDNAGCSDFCLPVPDGHQCSCPDSYHLSVDGRTCQLSTERIGDHGLLITDSENQQIIKLHLSSKDVHVMNLPVLPNPIAVEYDFRSERVYWSDVTYRLIESAFLNGTNRIELTSKIDGIAADGIALDMSSNNLFYTNLIDGTVGVMPLKGNKKRTLISHYFKKPRDIEHDVGRGMMFISDWGEPAKIVKADMSGKNRTILVSKKLEWPNGLALDTVGKKLFWCDGKLGRVEQNNYDGTQRRLIVIRPGSHFFGLEFSMNNLFLTDWENRKIRKIKTDGTEVRFISPSDFSRANDLKLYKTGEGSESSETSACASDNGGCSDFCLPIPDDYVCACPDGGQLSIDGLTCETLE